MEAGGPSEIPVRGAHETIGTRGARRQFQPTHPLRASDVQFYRFCEDLTEALVYSMVLFGPWAFGTTQPWSIWTMNVGGYLLGVLLMAKLAIRWLKGYRPPRWDEEAGQRDNGTTGLQDHGTTGLQDHGTKGLEARGLRTRDGALRTRLTTALAVLTVAILGYCLISALNARATYHPRELSFEYHPFLKWLPASFDRSRSWLAFWNYLGLACSFWAVRDWLLGKSSGEERAARQKGRGERVEGGASRDEAPGRGNWASTGETPAPLFPARLRRLLWGLAINGGLRGVECIAQRVSGSGKLLFLVKPRVNLEGETQFGPYAYRSNAAQYFNLLWPVALGFWWTLQRSGGFRRKAMHLLLLASIVMAACPIISTSRGGALGTAGIVVFALVFLLGAQFFPAQRRDSARRNILPFAVVGLCLAAALTFGYALGGKALRPRLTYLQEGFEDREQMYAAARPMAADYPLFGTGPGTFEYVFQLYRISTATYWPAQLHNDWLETRITFGWVGSALIGLAFAAVLLRWFARGGIHGGRRFTVLLWLALAGCLVHARYDFPFQICSIVWLFLILCAVLANLSRRA